MILDLFIFHFHFSPNISCISFRDFPLVSGTMKYEKRVPTMLIAVKMAKQALTPMYLLRYGYTIVTIKANDQFRVPVNDPARPLMSDENISPTISHGTGLCKLSKWKQIVKFQNWFLTQSQAKMRWWRHKAITRVANQARQWHRCQMLESLNILPKQECKGPWENPRRAKAVDGQFYPTSR